jgi:DNA-binding response OmpR family regulator
MPCPVAGLPRHDVRTAHDETNTLEVALLFRPELGLFDTSLPGMDGYQVARKLRMHEAARPFLAALTGYGQEEGRRRGREAGFDAYLVKRADVGALHALLGRCGEAAAK